MGQHKFLVFSNPVEGREAEYLDWYDKVHIPDILELPGYVAAQRFRLSAAQYGHASPPPAHYLVIYDLESEDLAETIRASFLGEREIVMSDAIDMTSVASFMMTAEAPPLAAGGR